MIIDILHFGDLHISQGRLVELQRRIKALIEDLDRLQKTLQINPRLLFFTGDVANNGENCSTELQLAREHFIHPLLHQLHLDESSFFMVPGNHDIDRTKISKALEDGISANVKDSDSCQEYLVSLERDSKEFELLTAKLEAYSNFRKSMKRDYLKKDTFFFETHQLDLNTMTVGIAALNSTWRSSQYGHDEGRLIIGQKHFREALDTMQHCHLKVVLCHHPFEMLTEWNRRQLKRAMAKDVDFVFTGHIHDSDFTFFQQVLGKMYVSTCASLFDGRIATGYSIVRADLSTKQVTVFLRKWYDGRQEFDAETEKCKDGKVVYENFQTSNKETNDLIDISESKSKLQRSVQSSEVLKPIDIIEVVKLSDVFVEPLIYEKSSFDKSENDRKRISVSEILKSGSNVVLFGRREYGKTTLLKYIGSELLKDRKDFESKIPVILNFPSLSKNNVNAIKRSIRESLQGLVDDDKIEKYLVQGNFVILIDDYNDFRDDAREKRSRILMQFYKEYPNCTYVFSMTENIAQPFQHHSIVVYDVFKPKTYYLSSFNTAKIRELLKKWSSYRSFDVDTMLNQIVFFFQQLQIPVTPMAVTLFIGVLFRDKTKKNIANEAYLIENYLEDILEKIEPEHRRSELDFRDKESFLAHLAFRMVEKRRYHWAINEFEQEKLNYFAKIGEDVPESAVFVAMFEKGILQRSGNEISFKFRFWFNFFLAKAMQKDPEKKRRILELRDYLKYATALGYKAGLDRNDEELLKVVDLRLTDVMSDVINKYKDANLEPLKIEAGLIEFSEKIEKDIREKNKPQVKDELRDKKFLSYDEEDQEIERVEVYDEVISMVTLYSDAIRNTTEIDISSKTRFLRNNVRSFICLMWVALDSFREFIEKATEDEIRKLLLMDLKDEYEFEKLAETVKQFVLQVIPVSVTNYMSDHLSNPKLKNAVKDLLKNAADMNERLFYVFLLLRLDVEGALADIKELVKETKSLIIDSIISISLRIYCLENEIEDKTLDEVINILQRIRQKYPIKAKELPVPIKDKFASDFREKVRLKKTLPQ
jgi:predicted MPP superfamily phosphohydrolase